MADVLVMPDGYRPGEADLTETEVKRRAVAMFGVGRALICVDAQRGQQRRFAIGQFVDPTDRRPEIYRDYRVYGEGASWSEALRQAELRRAQPGQPRRIKGRGMRLPA